MGFSFLLDVLGLYSSIAVPIGAWFDFNEAEVEISEFE